MYLLPVPRTIMGSISRRTLRRDILVLYNSLFKQAYQCLLDHTSGGGKVSLTLDAWSSTTQVPFLGITRHYIELSTKRNRFKQLKKVWKEYISNNILLDRPPTPDTFENDDIENRFIQAVFGSQ